MGPVVKEQPFPPNVVKIVNFPGAQLGKGGVGGQGFKFGGEGQIFPSPGAVIAEAFHINAGFQPVTAAVKAQKKVANFILFHCIDLLFVN